MIKNLELWLDNYLTRDSHPTLWVGLSGGVDSTALLCLLSEIKFPFDLRAIYINHGMSPNSKLWNQHCIELCQKLSVPLTSYTIELATDSNLEEQARILRYQAFATIIPNDNDNFLVLGHHKDDQAETLLFRLFRGSGPHGMAGIQEFTQHNTLNILRPLLGFKKDELKNYLTNKKTTWIEDESNQELNFDRNFIRQEILPLISQRWPQVIDNIFRSSTLCAQSREFIELASGNYLETVKSSNKDYPNSLDVKKLLELDKVIRYEVLRLWIAQHNLQLPSQKLTGLIDTTVLQARIDKHPKLKISNYWLKRKKNYLFITLDEEKFKHG